MCRRAGVALDASVAQADAHVSAAVESAVTKAFEGAADTCGVNVIVGCVRRDAPAATETAIAIALLGLFEDGVISFDDGVVGME